MGTTVDPRQLQTLPVPAALNDDTSDFDLDKWLEDDSSTITPTLLSGTPTIRNATPGPSNIPMDNELGTLQGDVGAVDFWSSMMGEGVSPTPSTNDVMSSDVGSIDGSHLSRAVSTLHISLHISLCPLKPWLIYRQSSVTIVWQSSKRKESFVPLNVTIALKMDMIVNKMASGRCVIGV